MREVELIHEIPFHDVDALNVAWHGHYYKYFELGRTLLFRTHHLDVTDMRRLGYVFPIVESSCRHINPLFYGSRARIQARYLETEYRLKVAYTITRLNDGKRVARGITTQVAVKADSGELCMVTPSEILAELQREPRDLVNEPEPGGPLAGNPGSAPNDPNH